MGQPVIDKTQTRKRPILITFIVVLFIISGHSIYGYVKPLPEGISFEGEVHENQEVEFLVDLTYPTEDALQHEQMIFERIYSIIKDAEKFILLDMFLFNDEYDRTADFPSLSDDLTEQLITKKRDNPEVEVIVITDPINTFYHSYPSPLIERLRDHEIEVILTDLTSLRDSNPAYTGAWRTFFRWFGTSENGWLPNPFSPDSPDVTIRSYLELLNFKANHRKVVISEQEAIVTSANPHDGSAYHSNIAFALEGEILEELIESEKSAAVMSGANADRFESLTPVHSEPTNEDNGGVHLQLLTEGMIKKHLLAAIEQTGGSDAISIGAFYLSDRDLIAAILDASSRDVTIRVLLDANKDAFGREKNGIPNRPVAHELREKSDQQIQVRWYNTSGEQYHTKLAIIDRVEEVEVFGGSANFTKRNLDNFNLETNVKLIGTNDDDVIRDIDHYFERLWNNDGGEYSLDYETYADGSSMKQLLYRFQEWSGLSTF
ncbi:phospholipase D family protein [Desertibacillus haloalkaliphilus]|uniref:phospholipase D family protein n=1 Tax=Desertibacillus haloalkaliphilus TaxID=1328930 RepID=UPI001C270D22|nr:phospholipase D family protein [Desertibacillus haloalkaliphilus]MBU8906809.1 phospholipase D family protein [Desertibacillus haloalkaliphilus]